MENTPAKIKHGLPPKHNPVCYQTLQPIVIPAGTILRDPGNVDIFSCEVGFGEGVKGEFQIEQSLEAERSQFFKKVVA